MLADVSAYMDSLATNQCYSQAHTHARTHTPYRYAAQQIAIHLTRTLNQRVCVCSVPCTCVVCRVYMCIRQWKGQHWCVLMGLGSTLPFLYPHFTLTLSLLTLLQALLPIRLFLHPDYSSILSFVFFLHISPFVHLSYLHS